MKYNDHIVLDDKNYHVINNYYTKSMAEDQEDLLHIYQKMQEQEKFLAEHNLDGKYNNALNKLKSSIASLKSIITNTANATNTKSNHSPDNTAISPTRGMYEMNNLPQPMTPPSSTLPNNETPSINTPPTNNRNGTIPSIPNSSTNPTTPPTNNETPPLPNTQRPLTQKQSHPSRPRQTSPFANLFKSFNLNLFRKRVKSAKAPYTHQLDRNKFHNMFQVGMNTSSHIINKDIKYNMYNTYNNEDIHSCSYQKRIIHNQIDIIRLFLLYLATRPYCKYCARISNVASLQCDILLDLDY